MDEDQDSTPPAATTPEEKRPGEKETSVGKLVKLRAFNIFAARVRDGIKDENPVANGHEIKRIVGQKWAQLGTEDKQEFIDVAQSENDMLEKMPVDPSAPKRKRRRKPKPESILGDASSVAKKKGIVRVPDGANGDARHNEDPIRLKITRKKELPAPSTGAGITGKGALGHSVNSGYLMTVRAGDTDVIFRGVVFDPFQSRATGKASDLAASIKFPRKHDGLIHPSAGASSSKQIYNFMSAGLPSVN